MGKQFTVEDLIRMAEAQHPVTEEWKARFRAEYGEHKKSKLEIARLKELEIKKRDELRAQERAKKQQDKELAEKLKYIIPANSSYAIGQKASRYQVQQEMDKIKAAGYEWKYHRSGIYAITLEGSIVYIGKSLNMLQRIAQHIVAIKTENRHKYIILREAFNKGYTIGFEVLEYVSLKNGFDDLGEKEALYINQYRPPLNYQIPKIGDYRHYTTNKQATSITLPQLLDKCRKDKVSNF